MYTINGEPYFKLDSLISDSDAKILDEEISWGLSLVAETYLCDGCELWRGDAEIELYDHQYKDACIAKSELDFNEKEKFQTLTFQQRQKYLKIAKKAYLPWGTCYSLNNIPSWEKKMETTNKEYTEEAKRFFPKLIEWCHSLPIFKGIGRIEIFGVDACQHVTCHRDNNPSIWKMKDQFVMLSPREDKKFYIYDEVKKQKIFTQSKLFVFDDIVYHGVDPSPFFTYSVRIDGPFNSEYDSKIIYDRFSKNE